MYLILNGMLWLLMRAISEEEYLEHMKVRVNRIPLDKRLSETLKGTKLDRTYMWKLMIPREGERLYTNISERRELMLRACSQGMEVWLKAYKKTNLFNLATLGTLWMD